MMRTPYLAIGMSELDALSFTHVREGVTDPMEVLMSLSALNDAGFDTACKDIGRVALGLMAKWYPEQISKFPQLKVPYDPSGDLDLILSLISKSMQQKTRAHIPSIEAIIAQVVKDEPTTANHAAISTWPEVRTMLEKNSN
jgi:hypothetical protein